MHFLRVRRDPSYNNYSISRVSVSGNGINARVRPDQDSNNLYTSVEMGVIDDSSNYAIDGTRCYFIVNRKTGLANRHGDFYTLTLKYDPLGTIIQNGGTISLDVTGLTGVAAKYYYRKLNLDMPAGDLSGGSYPLVNTHINFPLKVNQIPAIANWLPQETNVIWGYHPEGTPTFSLYSPNTAKELAPDWNILGKTSRSPLSSSRTLMDMMTSSWDFGSLSFDKFVLTPCGIPNIQGANGDLSYILSGTQVGVAPYTDGSAVFSANHYRGLCKRLASTNEIIEKGLGYGRSNDMFDIIKQNSSINLVFTTAIGTQTAEIPAKYINDDISIWRIDDPPHNDTPYRLRFVLGGTSQMSDGTQYPSVIKVLADFTFEPFILPCYKDEKLFKFMRHRSQIIFENMKNAASGISAAVVGIYQEYAKLYMFTGKHAINPYKDANPLSDVASALFKMIMQYVEQEMIMSDETNQQLTALSEVSAPAWYPSQVLDFIAETQELTNIGVDNGALPIASVGISTETPDYSSFQLSLRRAYHNMLPVFFNNVNLSDIVNDEMWGFASSQGWSKIKLTGSNVRYSYDTGVANEQLNAIFAGGIGLVR